MGAARLLHLADLHLDSAYGGGAELRSRLRLATLEAFAAAVQFALREDLDAVLIAGDAFDDGSLGYESRAAFRRGLTQLVEGEVEVVYVTGNHDPGGPASSARRLGVGPGAAANSPLSRVRVALDGEPVAHRLERRGQPFAHVVCAGHGHGRVTEDLAARFARPAPDGLPAVAVLHTQVSTARGAAGHEPYAPSSGPGLDASGFDYWALGHVHVRGRATPDAPAWYPGNLQGRNGRESGPKGGLLAELDGSGLTGPPRFVPFGPVEFVSLELEPLAGGTPSPEAVAALAADAYGVHMGTRRVPAPGEAVLRLTCPFAPPDGEAAAAAVAAELQGVLGDVVVRGVELRRGTDAAAAPRLEGIIDRVLSSPSALRESLELARGIALAGDVPADLEVPWSRGKAPADLAALTRALDEELLQRAMDAGELELDEEAAP